MWEILRAHLRIPCSSHEPTENREVVGENKDRELSAEIAHCRPEFASLVSTVWRLIAAGWSVKARLSLWSRACWYAELQPDHRLQASTQARLLHGARPAVVIVRAGAMSVALNNAHSTAGAQVPACVPRRAAVVKP